jgi:hypothetical protein
LRRQGSIGALLKLRAGNCLPALAAVHLIGNFGAGLFGDSFKTAAMRQPSCCFMMRHDIGEILAQQ